MYATIMIKFNLNTKNLKEKKDIYRQKKVLKKAKLKFTRYLRN